MIWTKSEKYWNVVALQCHVEFDGAGHYAQILVITNIHTNDATIHTYTYLTTDILCNLQLLRKNWGKHVFTRIKNKIQKFGWRKICEKWSSYIWMSLSRISASGSICLCLLVLRFISISRKSRKTKSFSNVNMEINIRFSSVSRPQKKPVSGWF